MDNTLIPLSHAVQIIKTAILQSQAQSAKKVNADLLALYFAIGGYISKESRRQQWGSGAILAISDQLQKELPGLKGFGETSIKNMRQFYEQWCEYIIRQPLADELQQTDLQEDINRQPTVGEMQLAVTHLNFQPSTGCRHARKTSESTTRCRGFERIVVWRKLQLTINSLNTLNTFAMRPKLVDS